MSDLVEVLIIGVGSIGERHLRCFQASNRARLSICETNSDLRERIAQQYGIHQSYSTLDEALTNPPEAAVIATPAQLHIPIAHRLAELGVHQLIEKPLSANLEGVAELCKVIEQKQIIASVAYVYRAHPAMQAMKEAIASDRFGKPLQLIAVSGAHFPTYRPAYRQTYYTNHATGGGAIQDAMTHVFNAGEWLVGPIERLVADAAHQKLEGVEVEDTVQVLARHGEVLANYCLNQHQAPTENTITVVCQNGTARFEMHNNRWSWMVEPGGVWQDIPSDVPERDTLFINQANKFLDAVAEHATPACTIQEGMHTLHCNLAALESLTHRNWQTVPVE
ncbi:Gfo/Idh/MocA family protein [Bythopirellula goksoeyrii]|uniref:1,5-anhydro-D-fructose reductase n=1 Tax=Bythopirellula goksoeyrii TaxID=1400387 RepID=A0A5B9Q923_9BACT|nr:Gfo/Idh/MocA family oxidoreductase [Bythopirellula goksoeyrii]QEG33436.1 1,5-anhydro-D-fructose reductase [Bythopirellula goksoeyrii]